MTADPMPLVRCEKCGEDGDLIGRPSGDTIEITCNRCGHSWMRDSERECAACGSRELRAFQEPLVQRARGNAYSIVGHRTIYLCERCDAADIESRAPKEEIQRAPREDFWS